MVIRTQTEFNAVLEAIGRERITIRSPIDFDNDEIIIAALGSQTAAGPSIAIDSVVDERPYRTIVVRQIDYVNGCTLSSTIVRPVDVALVHRLPFERVRFVDRVMIRKCPP